MLIRFTLVLIAAWALSHTTVGLTVAETKGDALQQSRNWTSQRGNVWVWNRDENGNSLEMTVRAALIDAARTIKSDHERGRVLSAIFK